MRQATWRDVASLVFVVVLFTAGCAFGSYLTRANMANDWDDAMDDEWARGFHWGWLEGCAFAHENWTEGPCDASDDPDAPPLPEDA